MTTDCKLELVEDGRRNKITLRPRKSGGATYGHSLGMYEHKFPLWFQVECCKSKSSAVSRRRRTIKKRCSGLKVKKEFKVPGPDYYMQLTTKSRK